MCYLFAFVPCLPPLFPAWEAERGDKWWRHCPFTPKLCLTYSVMRGHNESAYSTLLCIFKQMTGSTIHILPQMFGEYLSHEALFLVSRALVTSSDMQILLLYHSGLDPTCIGKEKMVQLSFYVWPGEVLHVLDEGMWEGRKERHKRGRGGRPSSSFRETITWTLLLLPN